MFSGQLNLSKGQGTVLGALGLIACAAVVYWLRLPSTDAPRATPLTETARHSSLSEAKPAAPDGPVTVEFARESWPSASLKMAPVKRAPLTSALELTGKVALNEDRLAHIFPLVEGRVNEVKVQFGDQVKKGDLLVVVQSKEAGQAMLQLFQDRQQRDFAVTKDRWTQTVTTNVQALIQLIRDGASIEQIEKQLQDKPIGEYRDQLMTAYIGNYKSQKHFARLSPLSADGAVTGKQLLEAEAESSAAKATLLSFVEQIQQDAVQAAAVSTQRVSELQTKATVAETNLKILGFDERALSDIDPARQGEAIAHYQIRAPFDGTVISKDVALLERVGPDSQIMSIADLSTVWVTTDIYEEHLQLLKRLKDQVIHLRSNAWPDRVFEAKVFYTGDVVNEASRTISMRAMADNAEGMLKPGMFVKVEIPDPGAGDALQTAASAVQEHEGKSFVFVHLHDDLFEQRAVSLGRRSSDAVEVLSGLQEGEAVVVQGGFALKSRMLAALLSGD